MLNIGFQELLIIGMVGLIVIGPERLPEVARFVGHFAGRIRRQLASVKADIRREMALEDMKSIQRDYEQTAKEMGETFKDATKDMSQAAAEMKEMSNLAASAPPEGAQAPTPAPTAWPSADAPAAPPEDNAAAPEENAAPPSEDNAEDRKRGG